MKFGTLEEDKPYVLRKFRENVCPADSGMDHETMKVKCTEFYDECGQYPIPVIKAHAFDFVARNVQIAVDSRDWFPAFGCWNRLDRPLSGFQKKMHDRIFNEKMKYTPLLKKLNAAGMTNLWVDFDHSVPDWEAILPLGFSGIRERARQWREIHRQNGTLDEQATAYFDGIEITYNAIEAILIRLKDVALKTANGNERLLAEAHCLENLITKAPANFYECLMFIFLYFFFSEHFDRMQARSLGNLDNLLYPFYERDLAEGRFTEEQIREFYDYFALQFASINNYWGHPFYLGGTDEKGQSRVNRLSYLILEEMDKLNVPTPKIQIKVAENTPEDFVYAVLKLIRKGRSSFVFVSEKTIEDILTAQGFTPTDARECDIRGCYEIATRGKYNMTDTGCGHINLLKPFELIFNNGVDPLSGLEVGSKTELPLSEMRTFEDFYRQYLAYVSENIELNIQCVNDFEQYLSDINPANVFSATIYHSLKTARDAFHNGSYVNTTQLLSVGFGSAVDALQVIKEYVYERKEYTLEQFKQIMADNWKGYEKLRQRILHSPKRYGNGCAEVDKLAVMLSNFLGFKVNGRPNAKGGSWTISGHGALQYLVLGQKTGATPDGRLSGEEMSKNLSPVQGCDISGLTALVRSANNLSALAMPGGKTLDVMMHPSTVAGDDGLRAWKTLVDLYISHGGLAIHFNVFDASVLKDAQEHPEKYANLQIRVCGWNVHFVNMAKVEQDMYIRRAEQIIE